MQNVKIDDPIELEEKILDLQFWSKALEKEVKLQREKFGIPASKVKSIQEMRWNPVEELLAQRVKKLEEKIGVKNETEDEEKQRAQQAVQRAIQKIDDMQEEYRLLTSQKESLEHSFTIQLQDLKIQEEASKRIADELVARVE